MVYMYLKEKTDDFILYEYYPEHDKNKTPGEICIDVKAQSIKITKSAEADIERYSLEFDDCWWWYGDHAVCRIIEDYNNGEINDVSMAAWY